MWNLEKINSQSGRVISQGQGIEEMGMFAKEYKLVVVIWINSGDLMYRMLIIVNNTAIYTWNLLKCSYHTQKIVIIQSGRCVN